MPDLREVAKQYIEKGYSVIPVNSTKEPAICNWGKYQIEPMSLEIADKVFKDCYGIALLMGGSRKLTAIDWDLKYSLRHDFYDEVKSFIPVEILRKMYVQSTKSSGFHWIFSAPVVEGNQQLAMRHATVYEKHEDYITAFNNPVTREKALQIASRGCRVLVETRGEGGYVVMPPTQGYKHEFGKIREITEDDYNVLMESIRSFNEFIKIEKSRGVEKYRNLDVNVFEQYDLRSDVPILLEKHGWEVVNDSKNSIRYKRPGASSKSSGIYDKDTKLFSVFTTSTDLENKTYGPASLFIQLECNGDTSEAYRLLIDLGYGEVL